MGVQEWYACVKQSRQHTQLIAEYERERQTEIERQNVCMYVNATADLHLTEFLYNNYILYRSYA